jgi:HAD superfamily hydrolase (TIGR01549 family)
MIKNILFDFDGVILDSMPIRDFGFRKIFEEFDKELVEKLIEYNNINGGLSRYVKIRYFYEKLLKKSISEEKVQELAAKFSVIMKAELTNKKYLITQTIEFIENNYKKYNLHIVSGSDGQELKFLCKELEIDKFFLSIEGSPTPKNDLVANVLNKNNYLSNETILIGDSVNDYEAAKVNNLDFYGYNNDELKDCSKTYIDDFKNVFFFDYGIGENSSSKENKTFSNIRDIKEIDYLIYLDSRGLTIDEDSYQHSFMYQCIKELEKRNKTYLAISRPKNLMTFATLLNFLDLNDDLQFSNLITNVGFVDFTPKKNVFIQDMILQASHLWNWDFDIKELSTYKMLIQEDNLYSLHYDNIYIDFIKEQILRFKFDKVFFINTPDIKKDICIPRKRPIEFFDKITETNILINKISEKIENFYKIDISKMFFSNQESFTYDAVHYTRDGHQPIKEKLFSMLFKECMP